MHSSEIEQGMWMRTDLLPVCHLGADVMLHGGGVRHGLLGHHAHHVGQLDLGLGRLQQTLLDQLLPRLLPLRPPLRPQLLVLLCPSTRSLKIGTICSVPCALP